MRLLVCGSRMWPGTWEEIAEHLPDSTDLTVIHGACSRVVCRIQRSVDMLADFAARGLGHSVEPFPVDHTKDGPWPWAGPKRNARMLRDGRPTHGLAFGSLWKWIQPTSGIMSDTWKRTGTGDMVKRMLDAGLPVRWVREPGAEPVELVMFPDPTTGDAS